MRALTGDSTLVLEGSVRAYYDLARATSLDGTTEVAFFMQQPVVHLLNVYVPNITQEQAQKAYASILHDENVHGSCNVSVKERFMSLGG